MPSVANFFPQFTGKKIVTIGQYLAKIYTRNLS